MQRLTALVTWPSAPLTDSLVRKALSSIHPPPSIVTSLSENQVSSPENLLQWSTYDFIDHDLTHSTSSSSNVLSSSYTIRKALIRKHFLSRCIHNYLTKNPNSPLTNAAPQTWEIELSFADELDEMWGDDLFGLARELEDNTSKWWMLKPGMADRGMGIRLFHTKEGLERIFQEFEQDDSEEEVEEGNQNQRGPTTAVVTSQLRHFVIQEYLSKPLLLDPSEVALDGQPKPLALHGYKFHLRVYCVASGALTVYLYTRILALFSAVPYSAPRVPAKDLSDVHAVNENLAAHLTNTSLQTERGEAGVRLLDELVGCHVLSGPSPNVPPSRTQQPRPPQALGQTLDVERIQAARKEQKENAQEARTSQQNESIFSAEDVDDLKTQIAVVLSETFKAALEMSVHFQPLPNAFELYGVDFLVTHAEPSSTSHKFQVHLLEVNSEPAIELTGPRLTWVLEDLFHTMGKVCVVPAFEASSAGGGHEKWEVNETRDAFRKCLDIEVRGTRGW